MHARLPSVTEMSNSCHIATPRCGFCVKISANVQTLGLLPSTHIAGWGGSYGMGQRHFIALCAVGIDPC